MGRSSSSQLALNLSVPCRWGGRRPGAGRKPGPKPRVAHARRDPFRRLPAHVTLRLRPGVPSLRTVAIVPELERSCRHAAKAGAVAATRSMKLDPASSARWFDGLKRWGPSAHEEYGARPSMRRQCPVARPRTWLLRVGWRRQGLLDPADVPGPDHSKRSLRP